MATSLKTKSKLFYMRSAEHRKEKGAIVEHNAILEYTVPDHEDFVGTAAGFIEEHLMFDDDDTHARGKSSSGLCPTVDRDTVSDELLGKFKKPVTFAHVFAAMSRTAVKS